MAFRTKRRRPRVVWLPNIGEPAYSGDDLSANPSFIHNTSTLTLGGGRIGTLEFALFQDNPPERYPLGAAANIALWDRSSLASMVDYGYHLRRIVGKLHIHVATPAENPVLREHSGLVVTCGLMVRRVDSDSGLAEATGTEANASALATVRDPWIWRRSWLLRNGAIPNILNTGASPVGATDDANMLLNSPFTPAGYGSVLDGPHVDAKTHRVVGPDERVFLDVTVRIPFADSGTPTDWDVSTFFDYRDLATLRTNQGNKRNASR